MLKKKGKRLLENADAIMTHLQARFPTADFETLEGEAIAVMSLKQQVSHQHAVLSVTAVFGMYVNAEVIVISGCNEQYET